MRRGSPATGRALIVLATLVVVGAAGLVGVGRAAPAAAANPCVAVIVDFSRLGGSVQTGCAQGDPDSGLQALTKAGFSYTPRPRDGLICQVDARPACTDTTTTTYWSYWYRDPGSSRWVYANQGAGTHNPKPGATEAWVWQNGGRAQPPSIAASTICPQLKVAPTPTQTSSKPKPTATKPRPTSSPATSTAGSPRASGGRGGGAGGGTGGVATPTTTSTAGKAGAPSGSPTPASTSPATSPAATSDTGTATGTGSTGDAASPTSSTTTIGAEPTSGSGSGMPGWLGLAVGIGLVSAIAAAALLRSRGKNLP